VLSEEAFLLCLWLNHHMELLLHDLFVCAVIENSVEVIVISLHFLKLW